MRRLKPKGSVQRSRGVPRRAGGLPTQCFSATKSTGIFSSGLQVRVTHEILFSLFLSQKFQIYRRLVRIV